MTVEELFAAELQEDPSAIDDAASPTTLKSWDSFNNVKLIMALEDAYQVTLSSSEIAAMSSVGAVKRILRAKGVTV